jgi:hypothetical protein
VFEFKLLLKLQIEIVLVKSFDVFAFFQPKKWPIKLTLLFNEFIKAKTCHCGQITKRKQTSMNIESNRNSTAGCGLWAQVDQV